MNELVHYEAACREIALATSIDEAKEWSDKAEALKAYARQSNNTELEVQLAEIKLRALRRLGELSNELEKAPGAGWNHRRSSQQREEPTKKQQQE